MPGGLIFSSSEKNLVGALVGFFSLPLLSAEFEFPLSAEKSCIWLRCLKKRSPGCVWWEEWVGYELKEGWPRVDSY